jgi:hypothetical protein
MVSSVAGGGLADHGDYGRGCPPTRVQPGRSASVAGREPVARAPAGPRAPHAPLLVGADRPHLAQHVLPQVGRQPVQDVAHQPVQIVGGGLHPPPPAGPAGDERGRGEAVGGEPGGVVGAAVAVPQDAGGRVVAHVQHLVDQVAVGVRQRDRPVPVVQQQVHAHGQLDRGRGPDRRVGVLVPPHRAGDPGPARRSRPRRAWSARSAGRPGCAAASRSRTRWRNTGRSPTAPSAPPPRPASACGTGTGRRPAGPGPARRRHRACGDRRRRRAEGLRLMTRTTRVPAAAHRRGERHRQHREPPGQSLTAHQHPPEQGSDVRSPLLKTGARGPNAARTGQTGGTGCRRRQPGRSAGRVSREGQPASPPGAAGPSTP